MSLDEDKDNNEPYFHLTGLIDQKFNLKNIMLFTFKNDTIASVDTTMVRNGTFYFQGKEYKDKNKLLSTSYIDFEFQTPNGLSKKLSDYVGKSDFILIDFWASWCGPCVAQMPRLKEIYSKYKDKGLEIISISVDDIKQDWLKALSRIDTPWIHLCDFQGSKSKLTESYNIYGFPSLLLLDKKGTVIGVDLAIYESLLDDFLKEKMKSVN